MKVIDYFGPRIAKTTLSQNDINALFEICKTSTSPANDRLVGLIREEVSITDRLKSSKVCQTILENVNQYVKDIDPGRWDKVNENGSIPHLLELRDAWYNKQVAMEYNPLHHHARSADLVCVIFPKIDLDNTTDLYYINNTGGKQTGQLNFVYGEYTMNEFGKSQITVQPEEGDMFVFPSTLAHYTTPVVGNSTRYSISCNFSFSSLAHRLLNKIIKNEN